jgi:[acyl-carrier-protein] S-malonyltransferase
MSHLAFVFPGQGSQSVAMLDAWSARFEAVNVVLSEASDALGYDLARLIAQGPAERLAETELTQPAILTASVAMWRVWASLCPIKPAVLAGHSLGEYSALVCAGAMSLTEAVTLVRDRGVLMQQAVPAGQGAMAAILGLDDLQVSDCCTAVSGRSTGAVAPVNYNSPGQVVIAGAAGAVAAAISACKAAGAKRAKRAVRAIPLAMSVPSHSPLLWEAAQRLAQRLESVSMQMPQIPIVHNVDASLAVDVADIRAKLVAQLHNPVRWSACVRRMTQQGASLMVECGPGKVLCGLFRRIDRSLETVNFSSPDVALKFIAGVSA